MSMFKRGILFLIVLSLGTGCVMEESLPSVGDVGIPKTVSAAFSPVTKVNIDGCKPEWHISDNISVFIKSDTQLKYEYYSPAEGENDAALFNYVSEKAGGSVVLDRNYAIYPYRPNDNSVTEDGVVTTRIINNQSYDPVNMISAAPMVSVSDNHEFEFHNIASILRFNIRKSEDFEEKCILEKITLTSFSQILSGKITVDTKSRYFTGIPAADVRNKNVHLSMGSEGVEITDTPKPFCISVFAGTYPADDLIITLVYNNGKTRLIKYTERLVLKGNSIQEIDCTITPVSVGKVIDMKVDCSKSSSHEISDLIFGSYAEMHGGDLVPGICEQYIVNTSFERWYSYGDKGETKNELIFTGDDAVAEDGDVSYPWEKRRLSGTSFFSVTDEESRNTAFSQRIEVNSGGSAALLQRLALPYYRISEYKVEFYAKVVGNPALKVSFHDVLGRESVLLSEEYSPVISGDGWQKYECRLNVSAGTKLFNNRYTQYNLWLEVSGTGVVYIDHVTLFPSDCIDGIYNPETLDYFKKYKVTAIRWPGGNYTSGYNWKNGIGPWIDRPCLKNRAWGGLDSNFLGIDEIARFCELADIELIIGAAYNHEVLSEQDIVDWVEYCNGASATTYGAVRAANGHPSPYDVKYWGIGNEVYGSYQLGFTDASAYSFGLASVAGRMKTVDPDICVLASGQGVHNHYRGLYDGWNETLYSGSSSAFDLYDCHLYVYGNDGARPLNLTGDEFFRAFAASNMHLRDYITYMRKIAPDKKLAFLEWGVLPKLSGNAYQTPQRQTFANLLVSACVYHEMIRNSDAVSLAAHHNYSFYVAPQKLHSEPVNMRTALFAELSSLAGGYCVNIDGSQIPVYDQSLDMLDVGIRTDVPEIDVIAVLKKDILYISCVNRNLTEEYSMGLELADGEIRSMTGKTYTCVQPYVRSLWNSPVSSTVTSVVVQEDSRIKLPPMSYSILEVMLESDNLKGYANSYQCNGDAMYL